MISENCFATTEQVIFVIGWKYSIRAPHTYAYSTRNGFETKMI